MRWALGILALGVALGACGDDPSTSPRHATAVPSRSVAATDPATGRRCAILQSPGTQSPTFFFTNVPTTGQSCGVQWSMRVPPLNANENGFLWRSDSSFHTSVYSGTIQNGPLLIDFGSPVSSVVVLNAQSYTLQVGNPVPGQVVLALNAAGDTVARGVTPSAGPVELRAADIRRLLVYPTPAGGINCCGDTVTVQTIYNVTFTPACPPSGDPLLDNAAFRQELRDALARANPTGAPGTGVIKEQGGWVWEMPDGTLRITPYSDPNATQCTMNIGAGIDFTRPDPGARAIAFYHTHPTKNGGSVYGCPTPSGGTPLAQTLNDGLPVPKAHTDDPTTGGGSDADWMASDRYAASDYIVTVTGHVYRIDPGIDPAKRQQNRKKWNFPKANGCATK